jgi:hypothetical protein
MKLTKTNLKKNHNKNSKQKQTEKKNKTKHYGLLLSFTMQRVWVNNSCLTPFKFCYFIKFNNTFFL